MMDPLHPSSTPYPSLLQSALCMSPSPHPAPTPPTYRCSQCNPSIDFVLLYLVYVCHIPFVSYTDEVTIRQNVLYAFEKNLESHCLLLLSSSWRLIYQYSYSVLREADVIQLLINRTNMWEATFSGHVFRRQKLGHLI